MVAQTVAPVEAASVDVVEFATAVLVETVAEPTPVEAAHAGVAPVEPTPVGAAPLIAVKPDYHARFKEYVVRIFKLLLLLLLFIVIYYYLLLFIIYYYYNFFIIFIYYSYYSYYYLLF